MNEPDTLDSIASPFFRKRIAYRREAVIMLFSELSSFYLKKKR